VYQESTVIERKPERERERVLAADLRSASWCWFPHILWWQTKYPALGFEPEQQIGTAIQRDRYYFVFGVIRICSELS